MKLNPYTVNGQLYDARQPHEARNLSSPKVAVLNPSNQETPLVQHPVPQPSHPISFGISDYNT